MPVQAAATFRRTRLQVAAFNAWLQAVGNAWHNWRAQRAARLLLHRWHDRATAKRFAGRGLGVIRRRLRRRTDLVSEWQAHLRILLGRAFWGWSASWIAALDAAASARLRRAWQHWRRCAAGQLRPEAQVQLAAARTSCLARSVIRSWRGAVAATHARRAQLLAATCWHATQLQRAALGALRQHWQQRHLLLSAIQSAFLHRRATLMRRVLRGWRGHMGRSKPQQLQQQQQQGQRRCSAGKQAAQRTSGRQLASQGVALAVRVAASGTALRPRPAAQHGDAGLLNFAGRAAAVASHQHDGNPIPGCFYGAPWHKRHAIVPNPAAAAATQQLMHDSSGQAREEGSVVISLAELCASDSATSRPQPQRPGCHDDSSSTAQVHGLST